MFWKQVVGLSYKQVLISYKPLSYKKKACIVRKLVSAGLSDRRRANA